MKLIAILFIPLFGTSLGAAGVYLMKEEMNANIQKWLLGFAGGVMAAASIWSLLIPSMELSGYTKQLSFIPALVGFLAGIGFLLVLDKLVPHLHAGECKAEGIQCNLGRHVKLLLAVTIHNIPEGMAVGVLYAGYKTGNSTITFAAALALAIGIALQNLPEGAIISMPLKNEGLSRHKSFGYGILSGAVEPIAAALTIVATPFVEPILPYLLAFAAGAMIYVIIEELIPETATGEHTNHGVIGFAIGFAIMMVLDVALGA